MRYIALAFVLFTAGCGRFHFDDLIDGGDGGPGDVTGDAATFSLTSETYIKASNTDANDRFGSAIAMSADGSTLAVSAVSESSAASGIDGNQADNSAIGAGAVYVFVRAGTSWVQQAYVKASNTDAMDLFGTAVALSADGSTLAVSAQSESSASGGIDGNQLDNSASGAGAVYVFKRTGTTWAQDAYVKASNPDNGDFFGIALALSADGATLAVGALGEGSAAQGIGGNQADNSILSAGAVYVFTRTSTWSQQAYIKSSNNAIAFGVNNGDHFGISVALSSDGNILAVGSIDESGLGMGVGASQTRTTTNQKGAVYTFSRSGTTWSQDEYFKASHPGFNDQFGEAVSLDAAGTTLAVGAPQQRSAGQDELDASVTSAGAVYVYKHAGGVWTQLQFLKAPPPARAGDTFGGSIALSAAGTSLAVHRLGDDSKAIGFEGDPADTSAADSGAAIIFSRIGDTWSITHDGKAVNADAGDLFGSVPAFSDDGLTLAVGAVFEDSAATGVGGDATDNTAPSSGAVYVLH